MDPRVKSGRWKPSAFTIHNENQTPITVHVSGRDRWALECLTKAGKKGCTPIEHPGPRWPGYVFNLRELGISIATVTEAHAGPFKGTHARYLLKSNVTPQSDVEVAA